MIPSCSVQRCLQVSHKEVRHHKIKQTAAEGERNQEPSRRSEEQEREKMISEVFSYESLVHAVSGAVVS